jgi:putative ABC transport system permease protein
MTFSNYFKIAIRQLRKNKMFSLINAVGLIVGMISFFIIIQFVRYELTYDSFHSDAENIYRVRNDYYNGTQREKMSAGCPPVLGTLLNDNFSEVEAEVRLLRAVRMVVSNEQKHKSLRTDDIYFADPSVISVFSFPVAAGQTAGSFGKPNTAVVTRAFAKKVFGDEDPIGKTLRFHSRYFDVHCQIVAVFKDIPENSNLKFGALLSMATYENGNHAYGALNSWDKLSMFFTYLKLKPGVDAQSLEAKIPSLVASHAQNSEDGQHNLFVLERLDKIHLNNNEIMLFEETTISLQTIRLLLLIAIVIMLIVWVNYLNLSSAKAMDRAKEVGIYKVSGARKADLILQFFFESFLFSTFCIFISVAGLYLFQKPVTQLLHRSINLNMLGDWSNILIVFVLFTGSAIISGAYPAFILSSLQPVNILKGKLSTKSRAFDMKKVLVAFQFAASIFLIAGVFAVYNQVQYMRNMSIGLDAQQLLVTRTPVLFPDDLLPRLDNLKQEIDKTPGIKGLAGSWYIPGKEIRYKQELQRTPNSSEIITFAYLNVNIDFIPVTGLKMLCGRIFSEISDRGGKSLIINETGVKALGFDSPESALNQPVYVKHYNFIGKIIGVVEDYHQQSAKESYEPTVLAYLEVPLNYYSIQIESENIMQSVTAVEKIWEDIFPDDPFDYFFLDDFFDKQYKTEIWFTSIFSFFTTIAILMACLGLFGISYHAGIKRTKEIGVRKVMGSSALKIAILLGKDTVQLILVSGIIAMPCFAWFIASWLDNYAFKININWFYYVSPVIAISVIAFGTISFHVLKTAQSNPAKALRYE